MILKGSQRGGGQNLAVHLLRLDDNEHVELHQIRGFVSDDLKGAFKEAEATSLGTKCSQYLFSLSLSPPEHERVSVEAFEEAIDRIEDRLGLTGQPRAVVFHEKEGRRHAHAVWSRIDADTMTARHLSFFKTKLMSVSRDLYLEHGWKMPDGINRAGERNPSNFSLAEWQQSKRNGVDPRWLKETVQVCWKNSDTVDALHAAFASHSLRIARGDKRAYVVVDHNGDAYSLSRQLGVKTEQIWDRLYFGPPLPTVKEAKAAFAAELTPAVRNHIIAARGQFSKRSAKLGEYKTELTQLHRAERGKLEDRLNKEWTAENRERASRLPKGLRGIWHRITGQYQKVRAQNEHEAEKTRLRQQAERDALKFRQLDQRAVLQIKFKELRQAQASLLLALRRDLARFNQFTRDHALTQSRDESLGLRLER